MVTETKLQEILKKTLLHKQEHGCSAYPYQQGAKLAEMVHLSKPAHALEIGTGVGFSSLAILLAHDKTHLDTIEKDDTHLQIAKDYFKAESVLDRVNLILGEAESLLPLIGNQYDFIFFDAFGIHYEYLPNYHRLLKDNGLLVVANNHLGSKTSDQFFTELHDPRIWNILEVFDDTTVTKKAI